MASSHRSAADRAREDISAGRLWKARDRLAVAVRERPADQELLELLGEVYFRMGDLPAAGRFWLPTARTGPEIDAALAAFEERWGSSPGEMLKLVPLCGDVDDYPESARPRLQALGERGGRAGLEWQQRERNRPNWGDVEELEDTGVGVGGWLALALLAVLGPGLWLLGIAAGVYLLVELIA
jgi:hypothetical protein